MPWEKVTDFKSQVKVGDKLRSPHDAPGYVTAIGKYNLLMEGPRGQEYRWPFCDDYEVYRRPERWKPKMGDECWFVSGEYGEVYTFHWDDDDEEESAEFDFGNCFRTKEQAEEAAKRIKKTLHDYQEELLKEGK